MKKSSPCVIAYGLGRRAIAVFVGGRIQRPRPWAPRLLVGGGGGGGGTEHIRDAIREYLGARDELLQDPTVREVDVAV